MPNKVKQVLKISVFWCWFYFFSAHNYAQTPTAVFVNYVFDGDSVELSYEDGTLNKARLIGIDAPEKKQVFAQRSRDFLRQLIEERYIKVFSYGKDRYQRDLIRIIYNGEDVNLKLVREGYAWAYFLPQQQFAFEDLYLQAQALAKKESLGLWAQEELIPPWEHRKQQRALTQREQAQDAQLLQAINDLITKICEWFKSVFK